MSRVPGNNIRSAISLGQLMHRVIASGKITRADEVHFIHALSTDSVLSYDDMQMLRNLMKRMDMGLIKVVNE